MEKEICKIYVEPLIEFVDFSYQDVIRVSACGADCPGDIVCPSNIGCLEDEG